MNASRYILSITDDYGNQIRPCDLPYEVFMTRCNYFKGIRIRRNNEITSYG